jgi:prolyl oligopeptidase
MKRYDLRHSATALLLSLCLTGSTFGGATWAARAANAATAANKPLVYPTTKKVDHVDEYHGVKVADPYRWLEDTDSAETKAWVEEQNKLTFSYLESIPERAKLKERMTQLWNYEKFGAPYREGDRYFFSRNDGLQNQSVLYTAKSVTETPTVLLDPNTLSKDGTVALNGTSVSHDGKYLAYGLAASGSDWTTWHVRDVETGKDLPDTLKWVKFSAASWTKDGKGFFYNRYDEPQSGNSMLNTNYFPKLCYHRVGTPQAEDALIFERPQNKDWLFGGGVTDDGRYLVISIRRGSVSKNLLYYKDLSDPNGKIVELINTFEANYSFIDNDGATFWLRSDEDAARGKVIAVDLNRPEKSAWKTLIPEAKETLQGVGTLGGMFAASYLKDAQTQVKFYDLTGKFVRDAELPGIGTAAGFGGKRDDRETFYAFTTFSSPAAIYHYDVKTGKSELFKRPKLAFKSEDYETKQVFYASKDGVKVPMFITHKKGLKLDGQNPTLLYGYGGFNISLTPAFSPANLTWMEMGGVYAQPNLRGGGEYGEEWHQAGTRLRKQNVFDDFIAAAEWLIANKYTSTPKLAISGRSNGGLLVGACMTQRPDLFGAALPGVGVMDMLRFHKFTIGWAWVSDYGSSDTAEEFKALLAYSPLHNLKPGTKYPPTLVITADHDDRVVPGHSFKFAATLQAAQAGDAPTLIRIETKAGHGAGKPTAKQIEEASDSFAFLMKSLGMKL